MRFVWLAERFGSSASLKSRAKDLESRCRIKAAGKLGDSVVFLRHGRFEESGTEGWPDDYQYAGLGYRKYIEKKFLNGKTIKIWHFGGFYGYVATDQGIRGRIADNFLEILEWLREGGALLFTRLTF